MVHISDLSFSYKSSPLFTGLRLDLKPGMIYGLLGKNGAGKTSLLKIISGQLKGYDGTVMVHGFDSPARYPEMLEKIFFIPEEFSLPPVSGVRYGDLNSPFYPRFNKEKFETLCREFDVSVDKKLSELSMGQRKKFILSFALASGAELVILDEPTNGLDIPSKRQFRRLVASSLAEDQTILISTHQVRDMEHLIDPIIILDSGRILFNGDMAHMAQHYTMSLEREEPEPGTFLYGEKVPGGYSIVRENSTGEDSDIDIEVFFNMIVSSSEAAEGIQVPGSGTEAGEGTAEEQGDGEE